LKAFVIFLLFGAAFFFGGLWVAGDSLDEHNDELAIVEDGTTVVATVTEIDQHKVRARRNSVTYYDSEIRFTTTEGQECNARLSSRGTQKYTVGDTPEIIYSNSSCSEVVETDELPTPGILGVFGALGGGVFVILVGLGFWVGSLLALTFAVRNRMKKI